METAWAVIVIDDLNNIRTTKYASLEAAVNEARYIWSQLTNEEKDKFLINVAVISLDEDGAPYAEDEYGNLNTVLYHIVNWKL